MWQLQSFSVQINWVVVNWFWYIALSQCMQVTICWWYVLSQSVLLEVLGGQCTAPGSECVRVVRVALATFNNEQLVTRGVPDIGPSCSSRSYYWLNSSWQLVATSSSVAAGVAVQTLTTLTAPPQLCKFLLGTAHSAHHCTFFDSGASGNNNELCCWELYLLQQRLLLLIIEETLSRKLHITQWPLPK